MKELSLGSILSVPCVCVCVCGRVNKHFLWWVCIVLSFSTKKWLPLSPPLPPFPSLHSYPPPPFSLSIQNSPKRVKKMAWLVNYLLYKHENNIQCQPLDSSCTYKDMHMWVHACTDGPYMYMWAYPHAHIHANEDTHRWTHMKMYAFSHTCTHTQLPEEMFWRLCKYCKPE